MIGANMSIKVHYLASYKDHFNDKLGDLGEDQGEKFHQDKDLEYRYQDRWDTPMMADYYWRLKRELRVHMHHRAAKKMAFLP